MATKKITELPQASSISANDLLVVVVNPASLSDTQKVTVNTFFSNVAIGNTTINQLVVSDKRTPANSTITVAQGTIFYDNTYIYIATSNNVVKRITLEAF